MNKNEPTNQTKKALNKKHIISLAVLFVLLVSMCFAMMNVDTTDEPTTSTTNTETTQTQTQTTTVPTTKSTTQKQTTTKEETTTSSTTKATTALATKPSTTKSQTTTTQKQISTTQKPVTTTKSTTKPTTAKPTTQATTKPVTTTKKPVVTTASSTPDWVLAERADGCSICSSKSCKSLYATNKWGDATIDTKLCPEYNVKNDPNVFCQTCGKSKGDGKNNTCCRFLVDTNCDLCGSPVKAMRCHTCK